MPCIADAGMLPCCVQDPQSSCLASFTAEPAEGVVPAKGQVEVAVSLVTRRLGRVQAPARIKVAGSRQAPLEFAIDARSLGPHLEFGAPGAPRYAGTAGHGGLHAMHEVHCIPSLQAGTCTLRGCC